MAKLKETLKTSAKNASEKKAASSPGKSASVKTAAGKDGKKAASKPEPKDKASKVSKTSEPKAVEAKANGNKHQSGQKGAVVSVLGPIRVNKADENLTPFLRKQKDRLLQLRDGMVDSMMGVAKDNLRSRAEGSEASAFGMHQADAGSDAYDRDFALSLLSQEQDALYEIDEALKRLDAGTYGVCEMSGKPIPHARLEAIPFARCTVECQSQIEKQRKMTRTRQPVTSLFGLTDDEGGESEEEETPADTKE
jgi:DnaK suppressor protein